MIYKKKLTIFFALLSVVFSIIIYKKFGKYLLLEQYIKLSIIVIFFIFSLTNVFLKKNIQKKSFFTLIYLVAIVYSLNLLLGFAHLLENYKETALIKSKTADYDSRNVLEFIENESTTEKKIYPYLSPREILIKSQNKDFMLISGLSNKYYAQCNESGYWKIIKTDKNGFNNALSTNNFDILLAGDSFADGTCVTTDQEINNQLTMKGNKTYSIGFAGNGILLTLASIIEMKDHIKFENLVWLVYRNDFLDLKWELTEKRLTKYLDPNFFGFKVIQNKKEVDKHYLKFLNSRKGQNKKTFSFRENFFELQFIDKYYSLIFSSSQSPEIDEKILVQIFKNLNKKVFLNKKNVLIVYLPDFSCFQKNQNICIEEFDKIRSASNSNDLRSTSFFDYVNKQNIQFEKLFKFELPGKHYSNYGYDILSNFIVEQLHKT